MTNIKSEDGLTHGWDRSNPDEWAGVPTQQGAQMTAFVIAMTAFLVIVFVGAPSAPFTVPALLIAAALYVGTITTRSNR